MAAFIGVTGLLSAMSAFILVTQLEPQNPAGSLAGRVSVAIGSGFAGAGLAGAGVALAVNRLQYAAPRMTGGVHRWAMCC